MSKDERMQRGMLFMLRIMGVNTIIGSVLIWYASGRLEPLVLMLGAFLAGGGEVLAEVGKVADKNATEQVEEPKPKKIRARTEHDLIPVVDLREVSVILPPERKLPWYKRKYIPM